MRALRRVVAVPGTLFGLWLLALAAARAARGLTVLAADAALGPFDTLADGHRLVYFVELLSQHPVVAQVAGTGVVGAALFAHAIHLAVTGGIVARLAGERGFLVPSARALPAVAIQTGYHLLARVLLLGLSAAAVMPLPPAAGYPLLALVYLFCTHVLDCTKVRACAEPRAFGPMLALRTFRDVLRNGRWTTAAAVGLGLLGVGLAAAAGIALTSAGLAPYRPWLGWLLGLGVVFTGLLRLSLAMDIVRR